MPSYQGGIEISNFIDRLNQGSHLLSRDKECIDGGEGSSLEFSEFQKFFSMGEV